MGTMMSEEQTRMLEDALGIVKQQTVLMRRCLETPGKLMDALKHCSTLVSELRTSTIGPKQYYELYMAIFDALRHLSEYLRDSHPVNHLADLYELVQYAGNIVPRLYLMITVGTAYMAIPDAPVKEIMKDMMEMSRGVQHPMRGLFLRYYLSGQAKDYLPAGSGDGPEGNLQDSIGFTLTNFVEMNKLWVRLQHQGHSREREQRYRERQELQLLVGHNLVRLSQLVDLETYKTVILQPLLEQVVQCRDVLAQEYLLEVITQVFADEFHLHTLDQFLSAIARLNPHVNVKAIVIGLMDRLSSYAAREGDSRSLAQQVEAEDKATIELMEKLRISKERKEEAAAGPTTPEQPSEDSTRTNGETRTDGEQSEAQTLAGDTAPSRTESVNGDTKERGIPQDVKLFEIFHEQVMNLVSMQRLPIQDITALLVSLVNLSLNVYPDRLDYLDQVLTYANEKAQQFANSADLHSQAAQSNMLNLLLAPIKKYVSLFTALALPNFIPLLRSQTYPTRRALASEIARSLIRNRTPISTPEDLDSVLEILKVLIKEGMQQTGYPGGPMRRGQETEETLEEQGQLARIVHLVRSPDDDTQLKLIQSLRKHFTEGGDRIKYTTPALVTACVHLVRRVHSRSSSSDETDTAANNTAQQVYKLLHSLISSLYSRATSSSTGLATANASAAAASIADLSLRLFLAAAQIADQTAHEEISYEFFAQAFTVYEESVSDSRAQFQAVCCIAAALFQTRNFSRDNYDTLITKCTLHGSRLLKKPDQCRAVCAAAHLWWGTEIRGKPDEESKDYYRDGKRVLECLQRALRVADACMDAAVSVELFVEVLGRYVYFFEQENEAVTVKYINGLIELIYSHLASEDVSANMEAPRKHFERMLAFIEGREYDGVETRAKT